MEGAATSASNSGRESEYSQQYGTSNGLENRVIHPKLGWKRNDSQIMPPFLNDEIERPNKSQQSWPWKDRAHHSDIFEPLHDKDSFQMKNTKKWPWQDRASVSHVFDGNNNVSKTTERSEITDCLPEDPSQCKLANKQWPWQTRAMTSEIFRDSDTPKQRRHKEYSWHQGKSTHNHKVDGSFEGVTQYMKDYNQADSMQKYLGPRHGYKYILKRRDNTPALSGEGETDFVNEITKMSLDDAAVYMSEAQKKLEENPEKYSN